MPSHEEISAAISRRLETDLLLGVRAVPLKVSAARRVATGASATSAATRRPSPTTAHAPAARVASAPMEPPIASRGTPGAHLQSLSAEEIHRREVALHELSEKHVAVCKACGLSQTRTKTVFGQGSVAARIVFVGEGPGHEEDIQGLAFVGKAGQKLTDMIRAMGLTRDEVFICNIVKCRPPQNRDPAPDEVSSCWPYLDQQLRIINPEVIVALGKPASQTLLRTTDAISRLRGNWHKYYISGAPNIGPPTPLMPTFHPAYLLRSPGEKGKAWSDLQMVMARLGLPLPKRERASG